MKKTLIALFASLFTLAAPAQGPSYEIDPEATAKAPWRVGEILVENYRCYIGVNCYTVFLGFTESSEFAFVQTYYPSGEKMSDPYLIDAATYPVTELYDAGVPNHVKTYYFESGQKMREIVTRNGISDHAWRDWDERGKLIVDKVYKLVGDV